MLRRRLFTLTGGNSLPSGYTPHTRRFGGRQNIRFHYPALYAKRRRVHTQLCSKLCRRRAGLYRRLFRFRLQEFFHILQRYAPLGAGTFYEAQLDTFFPCQLFRRRRGDDRLSASAFIRRLRGRRGSVCGVAVPSSGFAPSGTLRPPAPDSRRPPCRARFRRRKQYFKEHARPLRTRRRSSACPWKRRSSTSPFFTWSPSRNFHSSTVPSVMVRPSFGISISCAIKTPPVFGDD